MKNIFLFAGLFLILFSSCNNNKEVEKQKMKSVMAIHDEVMPKMEDIHFLREDLEIALDENSDTNKIIAIENMIDMLNAADEAMMSWMRNYELPEGKSHQEIMEYLSNEETKIIAVKTQMLSAIEIADKFINTELDN